MTGQIGSIQGGAADLLGPITPLTGGVNSLQFAGLGPNAQIDVNGALNSLNVSGTSRSVPTGTS